MIPIAAPNAEWSVQMADFIDAIGDGVAHSGNEVAGDNGKVCTEVIGHIHGATHLSAGHVAAEVNIADLHNFHAIESRRQVGQGNFDSADLIVEAFGCEAVHSGKEWGRAGGSCGRTEKVAATGINKGLGGGGCGKQTSLGSDSLLECRGTQPSPKAFHYVDRLDGEKAEERTEKPEAGNYSHPGALACEDSATEH